VPQIKIIAIASGDITIISARNSDGTTSPYVFNSVVAMQPNTIDGGMTVLGLTTRFNTTDTSLTL
jgi:hypothetical protein